MDHCPQFNLKVSAVAFLTAGLICLSLGAAQKPLPTPLSVKQILSRKVEVKHLQGFSVSRATRFMKIAGNVAKVISTQEFKDKILSNKVMVSTKDSSQTVYEKITKSDWALEYRLEKIKKFPWQPVTVGYTLPNVTWIVINESIFDLYKDHEIAKNICHEAGGHKIGRYDHSKTWNKQRDFSAPYWIGTTCSEIYAKMFP